MSSTKSNAFKDFILGISKDENKENFENVNSELTDKPLSKYFYKVKNHHDLFNLSKSFWKEYENGAKSFAFISQEDSQLQEKTILGIASYFDRNTFVRIGIICQNLQNSAFDELLLKTHDIEFDFAIKDANKFRIKRVNNIDFIDFHELCQIANSGDVSFHYEVVIQKMLAVYGIVLWDAPPINFFKNNPVLCFPMTLQMSSVSILVQEKSASIQKLKEITEFFDRYGVRIKGYILEVLK